MATSLEPARPSTTRSSCDALDAATMIDDLPTIEFGFDELRDVMTRFSKRFDKFVADGRRQLLEARSQFHLNVAELQEEEKLKERDIEILAQKASSHSQTLAKEASEAAEMQDAIDRLSSQRSGRQLGRDRLKAEISATRKAIVAREEAQRVHDAKLESQARFNSPELDFWTNSLCMDIEGAGRDDHLRFVFTHIDQKDWDNEACFELCTEQRDYSIHDCKPQLDAERLKSAVDALNETRDLGQFLKTMRVCFVDRLKN